MLQLANNGLAVRAMDGRRTLLGIYKKTSKSNELVHGGNLNVE